MVNKRQLAGLAGVVLFGLAGCASGPIADPNLDGPGLRAVLTTPADYLGQTVRWGGKIARVDNRRDDTLIEIVQQPLGRSGRPLDGAQSAGRFLARFDGFLDPVIYAEGKELTVIGTLAPSRPGTIGAYPYTFPVVAVDQHELWAEPREPRVIYADPWFYPYPGFYFRPYYYRYRSWR